MPFIIYTRNSKLGSTTRKITHEEQERACRALAAEHGFEIGRVMREPNRSGGSMDRAVLSEAITAIKHGEAEGLVVNYVDRFSRDDLDAQNVAAEILAGGGQLLVGDLTPHLLNRENGTERFMFFARAWAAQEERERKREYGERSRRNAIERGVHLAVPFGYRRSSGKGSPLEPHPQEAPVVVLAYELRADGRSWHDIAVALNHVHPLDGERRWTVSRLNNMVASDVYLGIARSGEFVKRGAHEPLVSGKLHERANRKDARPRRQATRSPLAGIVRCASCGGRMARTYGGSPPMPLYRCRAARGGCTAPVTVPAGELEEWAHTQLDAALKNHTLVARESNGNLARAEAWLVQVDERTGAFMDMLGDMADATPSEREHAQKKRAELRAEYKQAQRAVQGAQMSATGFSYSGTAPLEDRTTTEKRELAAIVWDALVVRRAERWREPVSERVRPLLIGDADRDDAGRILASGIV